MGQWVGCNAECVFVEFLSDLLLVLIAVVHVDGIHNAAEQFCHGPVVIAKTRTRAKEIV